MDMLLKKSIILFLITILLLITGCSSNSGNENQAESKSNLNSGIAIYRGNNQRTAVFPSKPILQEPKLLWSVKAGGEVWRTPLIVKETTFFVDAKGNLHAVDSNTGQEKWNAYIKSYETPEIASGVLYVNSGSGDLLAIDPVSGQFLLGNLEGDWYTGSKTSVTISEGLAYYGYGIFKAVDLESGQEKWRFKPENGLSDGAAAVSNGMVFFLSYDIYKSLVYAFNAKTGELLWSFANNGGIQDPVVAAEGMIYLVTNKGVLIALDQKTGEKAWEYKLEGGWVFNGIPAVSGGVVYLPAGFNGLFALDSKTGQIKWKLDRLNTGDKDFKAYTPVSITGDIGYIGSQKHLFAVDLRKREIVWKKEVGNIGASTPTIADGKIFLKTDEGVISVFQ